MKLLETYMDDLIEKEKIARLVSVTMTIKEINEEDVKCTLMWEHTYRKESEVNIVGNMFIRSNVNNIFATRDMVKKIIQRILDIVLEKVSLIVKEDPRKYEKYMTMMHLRLQSYRLMYKGLYNFNILNHLENHRTNFIPYSFFEMAKGDAFWNNRDEINVKEEEIKFDENLGDMVETKKKKVNNLLRLYMRGKTPEGTPYLIKKHELEIIQYKSKNTDDPEKENIYKGFNFSTIVTLYISPKDLPSYKEHTGNLTIDTNTENRLGMEKREITDFFKKKLDLFGLNIYQVRLKEI